MRLELHLQGGSLHEGPVPQSTSNLNASLLTGTGKGVGGVGEGLRVGQQGVREGQLRRAAGASQGGRGCGQRQGGRALLIPTKSRICNAQHVRKGQLRRAAGAGRGS